MRQYSGYDPKLSGGAREKLPAGGYVARIMSAHIDPSNYGDRLVIEFDIAEGEYAGFFQRDYEQSKNSQYGQKWRGVYRATVPDDSGTEDDFFRKSVMNNVIAAIQESNQTYTWNWDERTLRGLVIGVLFRDKEWENNGRSGWTTECCRLTSADIIRDGSFEIPKPKELGQKPAQRNSGNIQNACEMPAYSDADAPPARSFGTLGEPAGGGNGWVGSNQKLPWD